MSVETNAKFITEFNEGYPRKNDLLKEGDDHLRLIKGVLKNTLPGFNRSVTITSDKLNKIDALTDATEDTLKIVGNIQFGEKKTINMGSNIVSGISDPVDNTDAVNKQYLQKEGVGFAWPVGAIFISVDAKNPKEIFGFGEWEKFASGRVLIGAGSDKDDNQEAKLIAVNAKGGTYNQKLTVDNLPAHDHDGSTLKVTIDKGGSHRHSMRTAEDRMSIHDIVGRWFRSDRKEKTDWTEEGGEHYHTGSIEGKTGQVGSGTAHNNMMPYMGVNMWKRIS